MVRKSVPGIGTSNPGFSLHVEGTIAGRGPYMSLSDRRCKTQVQPIGNSVQTLLALQGVQFHWKDVPLTGPKPPKTKQWGFIAQEVENCPVVSKDQEGAPFCNLWGPSALVGRRHQGTATTIRTVWKHSCK